MRNEFSDKSLKLGIIILIKFLNLALFLLLRHVTLTKLKAIAILLYSSYLENKRDAHSFSVFFFLSNLAFCLNHIHSCLFRFKFMLFLFKFIHTKAIPNTQGTFRCTKYCVFTHSPGKDRTPRGMI